jgi:putative NIF3 family GTP cyclohydrolase 1 type 2
MRVLLDEDLPHKLRLNLPAHNVSTVSYLGWSGLKNGELLKAAEEAGFEVFLTGDQKLSYQQNLKERHIGIVTLSAQEWPIIKDHLPAIAAAIDAAVPGSFQSVECGSFHR